MAVVVRIFASPWNSTRGLAPAIGCALAAVFLAQSAAADEYDTVNFTGELVRRHDDNVFKTPDNTRSDWSSIYSVGARIDKPYSLQRFQLSTVLNKTRFDTLSNLDYDSRNYRAAWLWAFTPRLTGVASYDRTQSQIPFSLIGGNQINQSTNVNRTFSFDAWVAGSWHVIGGYGTSDSATDQPLLSTPAFKSHRVEGGIRWTPGSGNSITFVQRWIPTDNTNIPLDPNALIDTGYTDMESDLSVHWQPTGKSTIDGGLTYKSRDNMHFSQRNFSGTAGRLFYTWTPTGKLAVNLSAVRTILPYAAFGNTLENSTYVVNETLSVGAIWSISGKTSANLSFSHMHSDYRGPVFAVTSPLRVDDFNVAQAGITWNLDRWITVNTSFIHSNRSSNFRNFQFNDNTAQISAALKFGAF